jgi:hypothetical protein
MARVTTDPLQKLEAGQWPQDTLHPPVQSGMPQIAHANLRLKREAFVVAAKLLQVNYGTYVTSVSIPPIGDFWCRGISAWCPTFVLAQADADLYQPYAQVQIADSRTGYQFFQPYIWFSMLVGVAPAFTVAGLNVFPDPSENVWNPQSSSDLTHSHCFTRNSNIVITVTRPLIAGFANPDFVDLYFRFNGWLEYANASG